MKESFKEVKPGDLAQYGAGAVVFELGSVVPLQLLTNTINHKSEYDALQNRIVALHDDHAAISQTLDNHLLSGYTDQTGAEQFLHHKMTAEADHIKTLRAEQPYQMSSGTEVGVLMGGMLTGVVAGLTVVYGLRKVFPGIRSSVRRSRKAQTEGRAATAE